VVPLWIGAVRGVFRGMGLLSSIFLRGAEASRGPARGAEAVLEGGDVTAVQGVGRVIAATFWATPGATIWNRTATLRTVSLANELGSVTVWSATCKSGPPIGPFVGEKLDLAIY
jgi:hypothetical protein